MPHQLMDFIHTHRVNSLTLQKFVKNLSAPSSVVVNGVINGERPLAGRAEISHKSIFICGF